MESFKGGSVLRIKAIADGGEPILFAISLEDFISAHDRVVALMR